MRKSSSGTMTVFSFKISYAKIRIFRAPLALVIGKFWQKNW